MNSVSYKTSLFLTPPRNYNHLKQSHLETPSTIDIHKSSSQQNHSLVKIIGSKRLLHSFNPNLPKPQISQNSQNNILQDRFIPSRKLLKMQYSNMNSENQNQIDSKDPQMVSIAEIYSQQILGLGNQRHNINGDIQHSQQDHVQQFKNHNLFKYRYVPEILSDMQIGYETDPTRGLLHNPKNNHYTFTKLRKIAKTPCKVLDAPALQDDFYLNLIDWSHDNQLAVGLGNCIYLWNAETSKVTKLCELNSDLVTSVCWANKGSNLAVGCNKGDVCIWDVNQSKQLRKMGGHDSRVGAMAWNSKLLATGSRDKLILQRDIRVPYDHTQKLAQHNQQICGLKWSLDQQYLASGGNDNKVVVWSAGGNIINKFTDHKAAVKALAWSPHQHGLLATGGGTADRMIKMRNIFTGKIMCEKDAGSQVCNIGFSKSLHQVVTTHGYSQNEINIWSYPNMKKTASLIGHSQRVLYLAMSPDGSTIVTGAGDQTLRFWNVFPSNKQIQQNRKNHSQIQQGYLVR